MAILGMFDIKENLKKLPDLPGVYIHKDSMGEVIYVGKAVSLRNRVRQYFQSSAKLQPKVRAMVSHIAEFEYITCGTEMEALILECNLIKKYMPKYNVLLRDDKTYPYIKVTVQEDFPRVLKTRLIEKDGSRYFGPYSDAGAVNTIVDLLSDIYELKRCGGRDFPKGHRPCLNYYINRCRGVCAGGVDKAEYAKAVDKVLEFLSGKEKPLLKTLEEKMQAASENMQFEEAARYRDYIASVKAVSEIQRVNLVRDEDMDVVLPVKDDKNSLIALFTVREGKLSGRETFQIQTGQYDRGEDMVAEFLKQYYGQWAIVPPEILVERLPKDAALIEEYLGLNQRRVRVFVPKKGKKRALLELAKSDRTEMIKTLDQKAKLAEEKHEAVRKYITFLIKAAGSDPGVKPAYRIESYDISNTNGVDSVGAMVVFEGLEKVRKDYRRFRIKTVEGQNDYGSMQEMIYRRFKRALDGDRSFSLMPDLILMDGGRGQVSAAKKVLRAMKIDIPVAGMVKDEHHRTRAVVFDDGREIPLKDHPMLFAYLGTIQEEVHRFAIEYHRSLRNRSSIRSVLDNIPGIGPKRRNALLNRFKTVEAIRGATREELAEVEGMNKSAADSILKYFS